MFTIQLQKFRALLLASLVCLGVFAPGARLSAESLNAIPLSGAGDYEFLFFSAEKKPEIEGLTARFAELTPEMSKLQIELKKVEDEISSMSTKGPAKKSARLEWSAIEDATGYSIKLFSAEKTQIGTYKAEENTFSIELEPGDYYFQVAAVTKYKTGTYSRMTLFKVSKGKPGTAQLAAEERAEQLREKIRIQKSIRSEYLKTLRAAAMGAANAADAKAELPAPAGAAVYLAVNKKTEPYSMSSVSVIPGRSVQQTAAANHASHAVEATGFYWGAGGFVGPQDTGSDPNSNPYFRWNFGVEGFVRQDKAYFGFLRPQLKLQAAYSPAKSAAFDSLIFANLYPGIYFPLQIGNSFKIVASLGTGANIFMLLATSGSGLVLQWGVMPALEIQYALNEKLSLYAGGAVNLTYDTSGKFLKFVPFSLGVTRRF